MSHRRMLGRASGGGAPLPDVFTFKTEANGAFTFSINQTGIDAYADLGDGNGYVLGTNTSGTTWQWSTTYIDSTEKTVLVSVQDFADVTSLGNFSNKDITEFDASDLVNLGGSFIFNDNVNMTVMNLPASSPGRLNTLRFYNTAISTIDLSGFTYAFNLRDWRFYSNPNLSTLIFPTLTTGGSVRVLYFYNCPSLTSIDLSSLQFSANCEIRGQSCTSLATISKPTLVSSVNSYYFENCSLSTIDLDFGTRMGNVRFSNNSGLTSVTMPSSSIDHTRFEFQGYSCNLSSIDFSNITFTDPNVRIELYDNPNLNSFTQPVSMVGDLFMYDCGLTGTLDLSNCEFSELRLQNNTGLNNITFKSSTSTTTVRLILNNCDFDSSLDLSDLICGGVVPIDVNSNANQTFTILIPDFEQEGLEAENCDAPSINFSTSQTGGFPDTNNQVWKIRLRNNSYTVSEINQILVDIDNICGTLTGSTTLDIQLGGTNAAPDSSSGGNDGVAAKASLTAKGANVITN